MKILIADDDFVSRTKLEALLSAYGDCQTAKNGDEAIEMFEKAYKESAGYNLITMDIDMPGMNGHEVVNRIRQWEAQNDAFRQNKEVKILMTTGMRSRTDLVASFREGCEGYLRKPVTPESIEQALAKIGVCKPVEIENS